LFAYVASLSIRTSTSFQISPTLANKNGEDICAKRHLETGLIINLGSNP